MGKRKVTEQEVVEAYYRNFKQHAATAREVGLSRERVRQVLIKLGLTSERSLKTRMLVKGLADKGLSKTEALKQSGLNIATVNKICRNDGIQFKKTAHPNCKHTRELMIELYAQYDGHYGKIAKHLNVPQSTVSRTFKNRGLSEQYPSKGRQQNTK